MTPIKQAETEWKAKTESHPKQHRSGVHIVTLSTQYFRKFKEAIALINWPEDSNDEDCIDLVKLEKLPGTSRGAAAPLINFLKSLADRYHLYIQARVKPYTPDPPWPETERTPSLEELKKWYQKQGFKLFPSRDCYPWAWYPTATQEWLASDFSAK